MTHVFLDTNDKEYAQRVVDALGSGSPPTNESPWPELVADRNTPTKVFYGVEFDDSAESRMIQLGLASSGSILLSNKEIPSPMYAGFLPDSVSRVRVYLDYAKNRSEEFLNIGGLNYAGRTYQDPKSVILLDGKVNKSEALKTILDKAPKNWWWNVGFLNDPTDDALDKALNDRLYFTSVVCLNYSSLSRLESLGHSESALDGSFFDPHDPHVAVKLRSLTSRTETFEVEINTTPQNRNTIESTN